MDYKKRKIKHKNTYKKSFVQPIGKLLNIGQPILNVKNNDIGTYEGQNKC